MIVWQGAGVVIVLFWLVDISLYIWLEKMFPELSRLHMLAAVHPALVGALCFGFNKLLEREKGKVVIDKATNQEILLKEKHSLFFIPFRFWSFIFWAIGAYLLISEGIRELTHK